MENAGRLLVEYGEQDAEIPIWYIADIHYTNVGCDKKKLLEDIAAIKKNPNALWILGGDYCEWIVPGDIRFDPECIDTELKVQDLARYGALVTQKMLDYFRPIKGRCLGVLYGNHELAYYNEHQAKYLHDVLCKELGAPNLRYSAFLELHFKRRKGLKGVRISRGRVNVADHKLTVFCHHGFGAATTAGGKMAALKRLVDTVDADLILMAHLHESLCKVFVRLRVEDGRIHEKPCVAMITGSYLRGWPQGATEYTERRGYPPSCLGASYAVYHPADGYLSAKTAARVGRHYYEG